MAASSRTWKLLWSDRTYKLPEVVENIGIPVLVKIDEGIYEITDDRFTPGDLLQIHCKKTFTKVVCCVLQSGNEGGNQPRSKRKQSGPLADDNISIPIEYNRKLTIVRRDAGHKVYQTVPQLVEERPRYVRVIDAFTDKKGYTISAKSDLELGEVEKGGGLSCVCDGYTYKLSSEQQIKCLLLSDNSKYTIQEVIDRYPLPQTVQFCNTESPSQPSIAYTGMKAPTIDGKYIEIKSVTEQDVYIGTLNPLISTAQPPTGGKSKQEPKMVVLPSDSVTISQLEVKIPQQPDDAIYGRILGKTSPKIDVAKAVIEETIDSVNYPKVLFVPMKKDIRKPTPPLPSRPVKRTPGNQQGPVKAQFNKKGQDDDDDNDSDYEPVGPPQVPPKPDNAGQKKPKPPVLPKTKKINRPLPSKDEVNDPSLYSSQPQGITYEDEDDHPYDEIPDAKIRSLRDRRTKSETDSVENTLSKVPSKVRESLLKVQAEFRSFWKSQTAVPVGDDVPQSSGKSQGTIKRSKSSVSAGKASAEACKQYTKQSIADPRTSDTNDPAKQGLASKTREMFEDFMKKMKKSNSKEVQPPVHSESSKKQFLDNFSNLNTNDLAQYLRRCNLNHMADCVEEEKLNGSFFIDITEKDLESAFKLNKLQIVKFFKMRDEGWDPNTKQQ